jgi:catechol 2,3-dioxygenase-like lactoylglutathione lyase family enzyme
MPVSIDRRAFLGSLPALALWPKGIAQSPAPTLRARGINHIALTVSDLKRSIDFYQGLFGMPQQSRTETDAALLIGSGPEFLNVGIETAGDRTPRINHVCLGLERFDVDRTLSVLAGHGVAKAAERGPMKVEVTKSPTGTTQVYFGDPDGIVFQLQDATYCGGGSGALGNVCPTPQAAPTGGRLALKGHSHVTVFSTDATRSNAFYRDVFGFGIRSYQGPTAPTLAVGSGVEFLMFTGGGAGRGGAAPRASINHFCMTVENFDPDAILKTLEGYGIKPREGQTGPVGPMRHYISMRMENRGGAKDGTPELYFTDPDGILVQLQDVKYCGGSGKLGESCPPV